LIAQRLYGLGSAANLDARGSGGVAGRAAVPTRLGGGEFGVQPEFLFEILVSRRRAKRAPDASDPLAQRGHCAPSAAHGSLRRSECMIAVIRSHSDFSVASWRRPAGVIE
jgi:hypothetical protein